MYHKFPSIKKFFKYGLTAFTIRASELGINDN